MGLGLGTKQTAIFVFPVPPLPSDVICSFPKNSAGKEREEGKLDITKTPGVIVSRKDPQNFSVSRIPFVKNVLLDSHVNIIMCMDRDGQ